MTSPFPGVDPYIEARGLWPDFHTRFLTYCCDLLDDRLPEDYVARMEEHVHLVRSPDEPPSARTIRPDIAAFREPGSFRYPAPGHGVATLHP